MQWAEIVEDGRPTKFHGTYGVYPAEFANWAAQVAPAEQSETLLFVLIFLKSYPENFKAGNRGTWASRELVFGCLRRLFQPCIDHMNFGVPVIGHHFYSRCPLVVDATHVPISPDKTPTDELNRRFFSHKLRSPCLSYQIVFDPWRQKIRHICGPFPASVHDSRIWLFSGVAELLPADIWVIGDGGYTGCNGIVHSVDRPINGGDFQGHNGFIRRIRWQVEGVFCRMKKFAVLRTPWRHNLDEHRLVFVFVASLVQSVLLFRPLDSTEVVSDTEDVSDHESDI
jgi:hypothetical protein